VNQLVNMITFHFALDCSIALEVLDDCSNIPAFGLGDHQTEDKRGLVRLCPRFAALQAGRDHQEGYRMPHSRRYHGRWTARANTDAEPSNCA